MKNLKARGCLGFMPAVIGMAFFSCACENSAPDKAYVFNLKLGVCTSLNNAAALHDNGFDYVEESVKGLLVPDLSDEEFQKIAEKVSAAPLPVYSYNTFLPGNLKCTGPKSDHTEILRYAETAFRRAQKLKSEIIVFGSGKSRNIPGDFDRDAARTQFIDLLGKMGPLAKIYDITVAIEPLNKKECNFINTVSEASAVARQVNHPNIRVLADFYHMLMEDEGPQSIIDAGPLLVHCHIAEENNRASPGVGGENFIPYLQALKEIRYEGGISIECRWTDFKKEMPAAIAYIKDQLAAAENEKGIK